MAKYTIGVLLALVSMVMAFPAAKENQRVVRSAHADPFYLGYNKGISLNHHAGISAGLGHNPANGGGYYPGNGGGYYPGHGGGYYPGHGGGYYPGNGGGYYPGNGGGYYPGNGGSYLHRGNSDGFNPSWGASKAQACAHYG